MTRRGLLAGLGLLTRADAAVSPELVAFSPEIEPLVRRIENVAREKAPDLLAEELRRGTPYRMLLSAVYLAGVRNVNPQPPGFALHCLFVIHSAHQLALDGPADVRLFPLVYALDNFKAAQARDAGNKAGDWALGPAKGTIPAADSASSELAAGMDSWDGGRVERAAISIARNCSQGAAFDLLWKFGARDYRNIGHKAIFTANTHRTLQTIGWQHAEAVLRSLALGLVDFGPETKMNGFAWNDQVYAGNERRAREVHAKLPPQWAMAASRKETVISLVDTLRGASADEASADIAKRLAAGQASAGAVWDAVHLHAAELRIRAKAGNVIGGIHAVSAMNGLHHGFLSASDSRTRLLLMLQAVGWSGQFRTWMESNTGNMRGARVTALEGKPGTVEEAADEIASSPDSAASRVLHLAADDTARRAWMNAAIRLAVTRATEVHYLKYLSALIENSNLVSREWQPHMMAASVYYMMSPRDPESAAVQRARAVLPA